ncbi:hypothetical protein DL766_006951 [Monosporascus sp. MC13-8B]|nr:hypothetical protein DL763_007985 [Monosporascus cannonballus]RYP25683.1 hypothetical protein DL766_006951 [Monosporascus sp. MC13-8B]
MSNVALSDKVIRDLKAAIGSAIRRCLWEVEPPLIPDYGTIRDDPGAMQLVKKFIHQLDSGRRSLFQIRQEIHHLVNEMVATLDLEVQRYQLVLTKKPTSTADASPL